MDPMGVMIAIVVVFFFGGSIKRRPLTGLALGLLAATAFYLGLSPHP